MTNGAEEGKPEEQIVEHSTAQLTASAQSIKPVTSYSFAPEWFRDAVSEVRSGGDYHSNRREILFAVCCAESFLFEWVRDDILNRDLKDRTRSFTSFHS